MKLERVPLPSPLRSTARIAAAAGFIALVAAGYALAQTAVAPTAPVFTLSVIPQLPFAGDPVTVSAVPENFTASSTVFTWYRNGARLEAVSGLGRSSIIVPTNPEAAEVIQVRVTAAPGGNFSTAEQTVLITTVPGPAQLEQTLRTATSEFSLQATDSNPDPGQAVTVEVITFAFDKNLATYQWSVNGVRQRESSGRGQYRLALSVSREGEMRSVSVTLTTPDGTTRTKNIAIRTVSAPLYWWADTTVPYWYKGKSLPSPQSRVTVLALPNISSPGQLIYQWQFNGGILPQASGLGKSLFSFTFQFPVREQIEVTMKDAAGTFSKSAGLALAPVLPRVAIYPYAPKQGGVSRRLASEFDAASGEPHEFIAASFFFPRAEERQLAYTWNLNGKDITGEFSKPWHFVLDSNPNVSGRNSLFVRIEDRAKPPTRVTTALEIHLR